MSTIKPSTLPPKLPGSKEVVDEFMASNLKRCVVDADDMGRKANSVYVSLRQYLLNHPDLHVKVSLQEGHITLIKE